MRKGLAAAPFLLLAIFPTAGSGGTVSLTCSYDQTFDVKTRVTAPTTGELSVEIQFIEEQVTGIKLNQGGWCNKHDAFVSEMEISFPCAIDLAGQRLTFSFTFNRLNGALEQRFFIGSKLRLIRYGTCIVAERLFQDGPSEVVSSRGL
jgi:hypothetical protein